jgi:Zn-dependent protease with chaperone function
VHEADQKFTKAGFIRAYVVPALLLFAIPVLGYGFAGYADRSWDAQYLEAIEGQLARAADVPPERRAEILAFYREYPPSRLCAGEGRGRAALPPAFVADACGDYAQFGWIRQASGGSLLLGLASVVVVLGCAGLSFVSRELQYGSFVAGWHFLRAASAVQVAAQGFVAAMLSFWLTVVFTESYSVKLVGLVGLLALVAVAVVVKAIFVRLDDTMVVEGEPITRAQAPALWARIDGLCARLGTAPVDHVIGGIDDNFFVTEHPVHVNGSVLSGRILFVSLSLLKRLEKGEADAILAHEMAHFSGGDTTYSTKLAPKLARYRAYLEALYGGVLSRPVFYFMLFYWSLFQLALNSTSRERELRADRIAAGQTSPASMANALYKVAAYSSYRARVEHELFGKDQGHADLDIASRVAAGFADYARGPHLKADLAAERFPHPFDSHPPMAARLNAVGVQPRRSAIAESLAGSGQTWFDEIANAGRVEAALWAAYEARFQAAHAASLAYRYLPSTPEERAHVERYFPPVQFADTQGDVACTMDCHQIHYRDWAAPVAWADIVKVSSSDNTFSGKMLAFKVEIAGRGTETVKLPLRKLADKDDEIVARIGGYYDRYLNAKAYREQAA